MKNCWYFKSSSLLNFIFKINACAFLSNFCSCTQKSAQLLSSGMQKFHTLKLNYVRYLSASGKRESVNDKIRYSSSANFVDKHGVCMPVLGCG